MARVECDLLRESDPARRSDRRRTTPADPVEGFGHPFDDASIVDLPELPR